MIALSLAGATINGQVLCRWLSLGKHGQESDVERPTVAELIHVHPYPETPGYICCICIACTEQSIPDQEHTHDGVPMVYSYNIGRTASWAYKIKSKP